MSRLQRSLVALAIMAVLASAIQRDGRSRGGTEHTFVFGGVDRTYIEYVGARRRGPRSLVIVLHGLDGSGAALERRTHESFDRIADRDGAVIVYPDALGAPRRWNDGWDVEQAATLPDDVGFLATLIARIVREEGIDPDRVLVTGFSNGASMTYRLACERPELVAAIGPVSGSMAAGRVTRCSTGRPIPMLAMHGTDDPIVPFDRTVLAGLWSWRHRNGCGDTPVSSTPLPDSDPGDGTRTRIDRYACAPGGDVAIYEIARGGHQWPGGRSPLGWRDRGRLARDFDGAEALWAFFRAHAMPR